MEENISKICRHYDESLYEKIFTAYCLLDKTEEFFEKLNMSMINSINVVASEALIGIVVNSYVLKENLTTNSKENLVKVNAYIEELKRKEFQHLFSVSQI